MYIKAKSCLASLMNLDTFQPRRQLFSSVLHPVMRQKARHAPSLSAFGCSSTNHSTQIPSDLDLDPSNPVDTSAQFSLHDIAGEDGLTGTWSWVGKGAPCVSPNAKTAVPEGDLPDTAPCSPCIRPQPPPTVESKLEFTFAVPLVHKGLWISDMS